MSSRILEKGGRAQKKQENLRAMLCEPTYQLLRDEPLLPICPDIPLSHILPSTAKVFQSAMTPFCLDFIIKGSERFRLNVVLIMHRSSIPVKSLRRDSVSTMSDVDGNEVCKGCSNSFVKCTCLYCIECNGVIVQVANVGEVS